MMILSSSLLVCCFILMVYPNLYKKKTNKKENKMPFECGFMPIMNKKMSFSVNFLLMTMMFLIFDMEMMFLIPMMMNNKTMSTNSMNMAFLFLIFLLAIMIKEWINSSLEWNK